jgi:hypothetical protein
MPNILSSKFAFGFWPTESERKQIGSSMFQQDCNGFKSESSGKAGV